MIYRKPLHSFPLPLTLLFAPHISQGYLFRKFSDNSLEASDRRNLVGIAFSYCLYPFIVLTLSALYKWRDDKWKVSRFVTVCLCISQVRKLVDTWVAFLLYPPRHNFIKWCSCFPLVVHSSGICYCIGCCIS